MSTSQQAKVVASLNKNQRACYQRLSPSQRSAYLAKVLAARRNQMKARAAAKAELSIERSLEVAMDAYEMSDSDSDETCYSQRSITPKVANSSSSEKEKPSKPARRSSTKSTKSSSKPSSRSSSRSALKSPSKSKLKLKKPS